MRKMLSALAALFCLILFGCMEGGDDPEVGAVQLAGTTTFTVYGTTGNDTITVGKVLAAGTYYYAACVNGTFVGGPEVDAEYEHNHVFVLFYNGDDNIVIQNSTSTVCSHTMYAMSVGPSGCPYQLDLIPWITWGGTGKAHFVGSDCPERYYGKVYGSNWAYGYGGDDRLLGGDHSDYMTGMNGEDTIDGHDGADLLVGGADTDLIYGGEGDDCISGQDWTYFSCGNGWDEYVYSGASPADCEDAVAYCPYWPGPP